LFKDAFASAFFNADLLVVTDIYPARETPIDGVDGMTIASAVSQAGHKDVRYVEDKNDLADFLTSVVKPGDVVMTLGAGDIWRFGERFMERYTEEANHAG
jgi:UDP-N-acetylmuramate--alanine ligase